MTRAYVNGIPSAYEFKRSIGRKGLAGIFKSRLALIDELHDALKKLETFRDVLTSHAIFAMRDVRKPANVMLNGWSMMGGGGIKAVKIQQMVTALDARIETVAVHLMGANKAAELQSYDDELEFNSFYDKVALNGGGGVGRRLDAGYKYERVTAAHVPGAKISTWVNSGSQLGFNDWFMTVHRWEKQDSAHNIPAFAPGAPGPQGVKYLDAVQRAQYAMEVGGGVALDVNNQCFHTGGYHSQSGTGWGIYTVGFQRNFFVGEHSINNFHHSSFFAGAPVLAAGEIMIDQGRIVGLTNKTGHYKAGPNELAEALSLLELIGGVNLGNVAVSDPFRTRGRFFRGDRALAANGDLTTLTAADQVPAPPPLH